MNYGSNGTGKYFKRGATWGTSIWEQVVKRVKEVCFNK